MTATATDRRAALRAAATAARRAAWPANAGLIDYRKVRSTGTHVGIYDGEQSGMDTSGGRWQTVCEEHSTIISHTTRKLAFWHAPCPEEWCERCNGQDPETD